MKLLPKREPVGAPDCPLFNRWELVARRSFKLMVHHFLPNMRDIDPHDHPASFVTIVVKGAYVDEQPCDCTRENSYGSLAEVYRQNDLTCPRCGGAEVIRQTVRAPSIHFRPATHAHITETDHRGAWTIVIMGPKRREWGFWRNGMRLWYSVDEYENEIGWHMRCADYDPPGVQS
jgi:hypothetical protein